MTDDTCPACGEAIEEFERVGEISYDLHPCGHQVNDQLYEELSVRNERNRSLRQRG